MILKIKTISKKCIISWNHSVWFWFPVRTGAATVRPHIGLFHSVLLTSNFRISWSCKAFCQFEKILNLPTVEKKPPLVNYTQKFSSLCTLPSIGVPVSVHQCSPWPVKSSRTWVLAIKIKSMCIYSCSLWLASLSELLCFQSGQQRH